MPPTDDEGTPGSHVDAGVLVSVVEPFLGPHTARNALRTFSQAALGRIPDRMDRNEAELVVAAMTPMLRTLLGADAASKLTADLREKIP
jgi:hypothetical protein